MPRTTPTGLRTGLLLTLVAACLAVIPSPARAAVTSIPELPRNIVLFPERDFLALEGYPGATPVTVEVTREGVLIGTARVQTSAGDPSAEVNHPGGACWLGVTPDLLPGDVVRVVESTDPVTGEQSGQGTHVIDVDAEAARVEGTDVVVRGTARDRDGSPLPIEMLEQRIINPDFTALPEIGRRDIRATSDGAGLGTLAYDAPGSVHWTARYPGLSATARQLAVEGQTRIMSWLLIAPDGERAGVTIHEVGEVGGPGMPECPPGAEYAVTETSPAAVNAADVGVRDLVVRGRSHAASVVDVTLEDDDPTRPPLVSSTTPQGEFQAWSVTFAAQDVAALADGTLQVTARYTVPGGQIGGRDLGVLKDVVAPADAPVADPPAGTYDDPVTVALTAEPGARIHVTLDGSVPDRRDPVADTVRITTDATLRAVAIDAAGNRSPRLEAASVVATRTGDADAAGPARPDAPPTTGTVAQPPRIPQNVVVFPERDFVVAEGYPAGEALSFRVLRHGVRVAEAAATAAAGDPSAEVNHPGGACWTGSTPDLRPGDVVQVLTDDAPGLEKGDATTVLGVRAEAASIDGDRVVVHGTAMGADGVRLPLDLLEQRIINPDLVETSVGRRDVRATSDGAGHGTLVWDQPLDPTNGAWTATYTGLAPDVRDLVVAGQTRIMAWQAVVGAERAGLTIFEVGEAGGPGMGGCPSAAPYAVTSTSAPAVTAAHVASGEPLLVHGVSPGAAPLSVQLADPAVSAEGEVLASSGEGVWSARFPAAAVAALADGPLTVSASFDGDVAARSLTLPKDTVLPAAPVASPGSGVYRVDQLVTLSTPTEKGLAVHYTTDDEQAGVDDARYNGPVSVTEDTTLRAVAVDEVGNTSTEATWVYRIRVPLPPTPADLALDPASDSGTQGDGLTQDPTPTFVGTASPGVTVETLVDGAVAGSGSVTNGEFAVTVESPLADGAHEVRVRAKDSAGRTSAPSAAFALVVDTAAPSVSITDGPSGLTTDTTARFAFTTDDAGASAECSSSDLGTGWQPCTSPAAYGPLPDGTYTFRVRATDAAANVSVPRSRSFSVDSTAVPAPTPAVSLPGNGQVQATTIPVRVTWPGSTATDLARYELHYLADGGAATAVALTDPLATTALVPLPPGATTWSFRVTTVDRAGNRAQAIGRGFVLSAAQETSTAISWNPVPSATRWRLAAVTGAYGGSLRFDSQAGATATYTFTGTAVQWIAAVGPDRGRADVLLDGVRVATAVELHSTTLQTRRVMFARNDLAAGPHTLQVRVTGQKLGKSKGTRVDVDGFTSTR